MAVCDNFKKGTVEMMLLRLLSEGDMYGYQLSQTIASRSGGVIQVPEGSMYPTLYRMIENGYVSDRRELVGKRLTRVYYHLEPAGQERLTELLPAYQTFYEAMMQVLYPADSGAASHAGEKAANGA